VALGAKFAGAAVAVVAAAAPAVAAADTIYTVAGDGTRAPAAGVTATDLRLLAGTGLASPAGGGFLLGTNGLVTVGPDGVVGGLVPGGATLSGIQSLAPTADGGAFLVNSQGRLVRREADGSLRRIAGVRDATDVSVAPDGSALVAQPLAHRVQRVAADGTVTTVAGSAASGFAGDGGPATAARLDSPRGVAALADGGFVIADTGNGRLRRVAPDGRIDTVAGTGAAGHRGDGGPATAATLDSPADVAVAADGSVLVADNDGSRDRGRVRRLTLGGTIATIAGGSRARAYAYRLSTSHPTDALDSDGIEATDAGLPSIGQVTATDEGGVLLSTFPKVRYVAPAATSRLAVGITSTELGRRGGTLTFTASRAARVEVTLSRNGRTVATESADAVAGTNTVALRSLVPGAPHRVVVAATGEAGERATDAASNLFPGRRLTRKVVKAVATDAVFEIPGDGGETDKAKCPRRVRGARANCRVLGSVDGSPFRCVFVVSVTVGRDGQVYRQDRSCRSGRPLGARVAPYPS
jgi:hypothetical protein